ncbi:hypothetical protein KM043_016083 [Ampulex compressa]|nr:hypothetical protein KM043_016083 [Ampulex compressa]
MQPLKLVLIGPVKSGKSIISNHIADATEAPFDYHPTQGVRILEFEVDNIEVNDKHVSKDIELWDCSGDRKFQNCWTTMRKDVQGVLLVYSNNSENCLKELQEFYDYFVDQIKLGPEKCVILCFDPDKKSLEISKIISSTFIKISHIRCNVDEGESKLKSDFSSFLSTLLTKMPQYSYEEGKHFLNDNILFSK